ncbi:MAG TPA: AMP-binding protein [Anaerolineales bacterium]|nr:AMP-binding protein [Anaerolineales bacterium]
MNYSTLIQPVIERADSQPNKPALVMINQDGSEDTVSARQFHQQALAYANALQEIGVQQEDLVILVLQHSQVLLSAFWGALYLGAIPSIFPFLTEKLDPELYQQRVKALVTAENAKAVITYPDFHGDLQALLKDADCQVLSTEDVAALGRDLLVDVDGFWRDPSPDKIAFLQHSSGTTGLQKGVALSHRAVLSQVAAYSRAIALDDEDVIVSWLPLYHDMGLIAGFVMPLVTGTPLVLMSPFHWIRDPKILLWAIHNHKGTLCWLPNFAYNHIARTARPRYLEGLDLSRWRAVVNCSEPVYHHSQQIFLEKLAPYGFKESALTVSYAMAENTFAVTQTPVGQPADLDWVKINPLQEDRRAVPASEGGEGVMSVVSCGTPIEGTEIAIVNENGERLEDRRVGEIILRSDCMLTEYYNRPKITAEAIVDGWYHTGDMGYLADGELYITGRKKDLIIVGGKNVYPQDLEAIANHVPGIYPGRAVAFGLFEERLGSEVIVMVAELLPDLDGRTPADIERELRQQVVAQTEVTLNDVRLVEDRWVIKTSSGKIGRADNREKYLKQFRS